MLNAVLKKIAQGLNGVVATDEEIKGLQSRLGANLVPNWFAAVLKENRLGGVCFSLDENDDQSGIGAQVLWLTPAQIISEATECQPGTSVARVGYLPVGVCAEGSGDPYFLPMYDLTDDPPLLRVPHAYAGSEAYPVGQVEMVTPSLSEFFKKATVVAGNL